MRRYRVVLNEFQTRVSLRPPSLLEQAGLWAWLGAALEHHNRLLNSGWAGGFGVRRTEILTSPSQPWVSRDSVPNGADSRLTQCSNGESRAKLS